jgi:hypothetical protein
LGPALGGGLIGKIWRPERVSIHLNIIKNNMWGRDNDVGRNNNPDEYGELNKADIGYAVRKFLNDASDYAEHEEYVEIKRIMNVFMEYVEDL